MFCAISGEVPQDPVVSTVSGNLFERRLAEKYVDENARDPISGEPMGKTDLISVKGGAPSAASARPSAAMSIPGLLQTLHSEWDAMVLEQFSLRQQLTTTQQELAHALYQHDAACRVIARLMKERDEARANAAGAINAQLDHAPGHVDEGNGTAQAAPAVDRTKTPDDYRQELSKTQAGMKQARMKRTVSATLNSPDGLRNLTEVHTAAPHQKGSSVNTVAISERNGAKTIFSGGNDGKVVCYDRALEQTAGVMVGHTKPVTCVVTHPDGVVSGSEDGTCRLWTNDAGSFHTACIVKEHEKAVVGLTVLPTNRHIVSAGADGRVVLSDIAVGKALTVHETNSEFTTLGAHGDGFLLGLGVNGSLQIWDARVLSHAASLPHDTLGPVQSVDFNENGYNLVTAAASVVKLWDLRMLKGSKTMKDVLTVPFDWSVTDAKFDYSGQYIAAGGTNVTVLDLQGNRLNTLVAHTSPAQAVAWGSDAKWLVSGGKDSAVKVYA